MHIRANLASVSRFKPATPTRQKVATHSHFKVATLSRKATHGKESKGKFFFRSLCFVLLFFVLVPVNASMPNPVRTEANRFVAQSFICNATKFSEVPRLSALPPQLLKSLGSVSDKGGEFNAGDVGGGPHERFITGAISQDVVVMAAEHGGIGYNVQLWSFLKNGANWDAGPAGYYGFSASIPFDTFLTGAGQAFGCKNKIGTGSNSKRY